MTRLLAILALALFATLVCAQSAVPDGEVAKSMRLIGSAYRVAPFAERVTIEVEGDQGFVTSEQIEVRAQVRTIGEPAPTRIVLELGRLEIDASAGQIVATRADNPNEAVVRPIDGLPTLEELELAFPPVPLPQLDFALKKVPGRLTPYANNVRFTDLAVGASEDDEFILTMTGESDEGPVTVVANASTGRLRLVEIKRWNTPDALTVRLTFEQLDPGNPLRWGTDASERELIDAVGELRQRSDRIAIGEALPNLTFVRAEGGLWTLDQAGLAQTVVGGPPAARDARSLALVLYRDAGDDQTTPLLASATRAIGDVREQLEFGPSSGVLASTLVCVVPLNEFDADGLQADGQRWGAPGSGVPTIVWTPSPGESIDRLAPDAQCVVVLIGSGRVVRAIVPVVGTDENAEFVRTELMGALGLEP